VKLRNIPVEYSRTGLCEDLARLGFGYAIDFLYLPIDGSTGRNEGHAFVNVRSQDAYRDFKQTFEGVKAATCLPAYESDAICEVDIAEVQGRDANMQKLCTTDNLAKWTKNDEWQPLFLDDYGNKMPLVAASSPRANGLNGKQASPRQRSNSEQWPRGENFQASPKFTHKASPTLKAQRSPQMKAGQSPQMKASPVLRAQAKEFTPSLNAAEHKADEPAVLASSLRADAAVWSPSLRADASEFVPSSVEAFVLEPACVD